MSMSRVRTFFTISMTFLVSMGNFGVHLPETIALVFSIPFDQTTLIAKIFVGKNKSSMNF